MNWEVAGAWGAVVFGILGVLLLILWFFGGQKNAILRIGGGISVLFCVLSVLLMNMSA